MNLVFPVGILASWVGFLAYIAVEKFSFRSSMVGGGEGRSTVLGKL